MAARKWDSTLITKAIRRLYRKGFDISYSSMARAHQDLVSAANYYYGTYRKAVLSCGIDYERLRHKPGWHRDSVVEVLRKAQRRHEPLNWASVSARPDQLGHAAKAAVRKRLFGNWDDALSAAGIDPSKVRCYRPWNPAAILQELRRRKRLRLGLNPKAMQAELPGLYDAARRHFGSYREALARAGCDPLDVLQRREWSHRAVCEALREFERNFELVSQVMLRDLDSGLMRAVRVWYGNLPAAIKAAGVRNYSVRGHRAVASRPKRHRRAAASGTR